jgi:hypothetical protein
MKRKQLQKPPPLTSSLATPSARLHYDSSATGRNRQPAAQPRASGEVHGLRSQRSWLGFERGYNVSGVSGVSIPVLKYVSPFPIAHPLTSSPVCSARWGGVDVLLDMSELMEVKYVVGVIMARMCVCAAPCGLSSHSSWHYGRAGKLMMRQGVGTQARTLDTAMCR